MAENGNGAAPAEAPQVKRQVLGQFIRDMSFDHVMAQKGVEF